MLHSGVGIRRVGGDAAHVVSHCCNHFRRQDRKTMAVAAEVTVQLQVGDGVEKPSDSVFSPEGGEGRGDETERWRRWVHCCEWRPLELA